MCPGRSAARALAKRCAADPGPLRTVAVRISGAPHPGNGSASQCKLVGQVTPVGIEFLNELEFPRSPPALKTCFSCTSFQNGFILFVIDEHDDAVRSCESWYQLRLVPGEAPDEVVGQTDVEHSAPSIRKNVDEDSSAHCGSCVRVRCGASAN